MWNDDLIAQERLVCRRSARWWPSKAGLKRRTIEVRVCDDDSGGAGIDAGDQAPTVGDHQGRGDATARRHHHHDQGWKTTTTPDVPAAPRIDLRSALHRSRTIVAARQGARRRKPARPRKAPCAPRPDPRRTAAGAVTNPSHQVAAPPALAAGYRLPAPTAGPVRSIHPGPGCPPGG